MRKSKFLYSWLLGFLIYWSLKLTLGKALNTACLFSPKIAFSKLTLVKRKLLWLCVILLLMLRKVDLLVLSESVVRGNVFGRKVTEPSADFLTGKIYKWEKFIRLPSSHSLSPQARAFFLPSMFRSKSQFKGYREKVSRKFQTTMLAQRATE